MTTSGSTTCSPPTTIRQFIVLVNCDYGQLINELESKNEFGVVALLDGLVTGVMNDELHGSDKADTSDIIKYYQILNNIVWSRIHIGNWDQVNVEWRNLYSFITIIQSLHTIQRCNQINNNNYKEVLKKLDYCLLIGGNRFREVINSLINSIASHLDSNHIDNINNNSNNSNDNNIAIIKDIKYQIAKCIKPSREEFKELYFTQHKPIIISGAMNDWKALQKWNISYIQSIAGHRTIPIEIGKTYLHDDWSQQLITMNDFIDQYINNNNKGIGYLAQTKLFDQIPELKDDIKIPEYCKLTLPSTTNNDKEEHVIVNAWFGPSSTTTPLHYDPYHNIFCQVIGRKYIRLYDADQSEYLYPWDSKLRYNTSQVDIEDPDLTKYPLFSNSTYQECILNPGEMLYIPPKCWHFVKSLDTSFSLSYWWL